MARKGKRTTSDDISRDFVSAIERLRKGEPVNPRLKEAARRGKLRINVSTVALEAGRSRTLLASADGKFAHVRKLMAPVTEVQDAKPRNLTGLLADMRRELADVRAKLKNQQGQTVEHFHARRAAERRAEKWQRAYQRAKLGNVTSTNVIPFPLAPKLDEDGN